MTSTIETGHAKNVSSFESLVMVCQGLSAYNPSTPAITITGLTTKLTDARAAIRNSIDAEDNFKIVTNKRGEAFRSLRPLATRMINALAASGALEAIIKDARTVVRKMGGKRATPKPGEVENEGGTEVAAAPTTKTISVSQQSFDQQLEHFTRLIGLLSREPKYSPNEGALKVTTLNTHLDTLRNANTQVIGAYDNWENNRIHRGRVLYDPMSGLTTVAQQAKSYIKAAFGASSEEYKKVEKLPFRVLKY